MEQALEQCIEGLLKMRWLRYCKRCGDVFEASSKTGKICDDCHRPNYGAKPSRGLDLRYWSIKEKKNE